jgi:hypothetical protein
MQPQPAPGKGADWHRPADDVPELGIEVPNTAWLTRRPS